MKRIVFVGGGHSHLRALERIASRRLGVEIILINDSESYVYSGMVPGVLIGEYKENDAKIDLRDFCNRHQIKFKIGKLADLTSSKIKLDSGELVDFDICSVNIGSQTQEIPSDVISPLISVKPLERFLRSWQKSESKRVSLVKAAVIGGGAGAIEIACALQLQLGPEGQVQLFYAEETPLPRNPSVGLEIEADLRSLGVGLHSLSKVKAVRDSCLILESEKVLGEFQWIVNCTGARSPFVETSIDRNILSDEGYLKVDATLQVIGLPHVFAAGDCIQFEPKTLEKSGVHAVRQGRVLAHNIEKRVTEKGSGRLKTYKPPRKQLAIVLTGFRKARIVWGNKSWSARWFYQLKRWIDRRYVQRFYEVLHDK